MAALFAGVAPALADTVLIKTTPREGVSLARTPEAVQALHEGPLGAVTHATASVDGRDALAGPARLDPNDVRRALIPLRDEGPGIYRVNWTVQAADGHPLVEGVSFRVEGESFIALTHRVSTLLERAARILRLAAARAAASS